MGEMPAVYRPYLNAKLIPCTAMQKLHIARRTALVQRLATLCLPPSLPATHQEVAHAPRVRNISIGIAVHFCL